MILFIKILEKIFLPPGIFFILLGISFFSVQKRKIARICIGVIFVLFYTLSIAPGAYALNRVLEAPFDQEKNIPSPQENDLIVVLASGASSKERSFQELFGTSLIRLWRGIELYHSFDKKIPILYTGDSGKIFNKDIQEPVLAKKYAERAGVPSDNFLTDSEASTTHESTLNVKKILQVRFGGESRSRVYLVTSARHMQRSVQDFERNGMTAVPVPADFVTDKKFQITLFSFFPDSEQFNSSMGALHEFIGSLGYRFYSKSP